MNETTDNVIARLGRRNGQSELPAPAYLPPREPSRRVMLAVSSMRHHMTDEGWQLAEGLGVAGYALCGHGEPLDGLTDAREILARHSPGVVLVQDKREWVGGNYRDPQARFTQVSALKERPDVFRLMAIKDTHQRPNFYREASDEVGCHAWVVHYHPRIVAWLAPYMRGQHIVRAYHTVDPADVPSEPWAGKVRGCLLSGAVIHPYYPLRARLFASAHRLPYTDVLRHPGYHRNGSATPGFLRTLAAYRVAVCTASIYGYALRKLVEATACGCVVITNLPADDPLPGIDGNLIRVASSASVEEVGAAIALAVTTYNPERQRTYALEAVKRYSFVAEGARLAGEIEKMRSNYR